MSTTEPTVGALAELYLGNVLYALERCALSLDEEGKPLDAAFYRGIGRQLADAHGRARRGATAQPAHPPIGPSGGPPG